MLIYQDDETYIFAVILDPRFKLGLHNALN